MWAGDGRFTVDRIARGTLDIPACCVSIIGTVQPGPLQSYLFQLAAGGAGDDGLLPRFQLLVWPDVPPTWQNVDRWPDKAAKQRAYEVFDRLADLDPSTVGAEQDDDDGLPFLRFDSNAQAAFDEWRGDLERTLRSGTLAPALEAVSCQASELDPVNGAAKSPGGRRPRSRAAIVSSTRPWAGGAIFSPMPGESTGASGRAIPPMVKPYWTRLAALAAG